MTYSKQKWKGPLRTFSKHYETLPAALFLIQNISAHNAGFIWNVVQCSTFQINPAFFAEYFLLVLKTVLHQDFPAIFPKYFPPYGNILRHLVFPQHFPPYFWISRHIFEKIQTSKWTNEKSFRARSPQRTRSQQHLHHHKTHRVSSLLLQQGVRFDPDLPQTIRLEFAKSNTKVSKTGGGAFYFWEIFYFVPVRLCLFLCFTHWSILIMLRLRLDPGTFCPRIINASGQKFKKINFYLTNHLQNYKFTCNAPS